MEELIVVSFFRTLPDFFRMDPPYITIYALTFLGAAITEFLILYKTFPDFLRKKAGWILPVAFLALEICCEWLYQLIPGWDALLFAIVGFVCLFGLLGVLAGWLFHMIFNACAAENRKNP